MLSRALRANGLFVNFGSQRFSIGNLCEDATNAIGLEVVAHDRKEPYKVRAAVVSSDERIFNELLDADIWGLSDAISKRKEEIVSFGVDRFIDLALERLKRGRFTEPELYAVAISLRQNNLFASPKSLFVSYCPREGILEDEVRRHIGRSTADLYA
jgi:hypothetical protein